jgi:plasmid maintenance system antidote protein VapI
MENSINQRIKQLIELLGINQNEFGRNTDIKSGHISQLINKEINVTSRIITKIKCAFPQTNADWLLFGTGSPILDMEDLDREKKIDYVNADIDVLIVKLKNEIDHFKMEIDKNNRLIEILKSKKK